MGFWEAFRDTVAEDEAPAGAVSAEDAHLAAWRGLRGRGLPEMRVIADVLQPYQGWNAIVVGECRARLYTDREGGSLPVVVLTDLHRGPSVMNMAEDVATRVAVRFGLPPATLWILHLPADYPALRIYGKRGREQFLIVTFSPTPGSNPWGSDAGTSFKKLSEAEADQLRYWLPLSIPLPDSAGDS